MRLSHNCSSVCKMYNYGLREMEYNIAMFTVESYHLHIVSVFDCLEYTQSSLSFCWLKICHLNALSFLGSHHVSTEAQKGTKSNIPKAQVNLNKILHVSSSFI